MSYYYGREAGLELREDVETVIEPGMVGFTINYRFLELLGSMSLTDF